MYQYNPNNYDPNRTPSFSVIPVGRHRVRISAAEWYTSKNSGKESIKITLDVSGYSSKLWHYIGTTFSTDKEKADIDQRVGDFMSKMGINSFDPTFRTWLGKVGGVDVKHETYNGQTSPKIKFFLRPEECKQLPPWKEGESNGGLNQYSAGASVDIGDMNASAMPVADDIPF